MEEARLDLDPRITFLVSSVRDVDDRDLRTSIALLPIHSTDARFVDFHNRQHHGQHSTRALPLAHNPMPHWKPRHIDLQSRCPTPQIASHKFGSTTPKLSWAAPATQQFGATSKAGA
jgi:hypothetical protein